MLTDGLPLAPAPAGAPFDIVFLDRDGTLNVRVVGDYVRTPEQLELLPGAASAVARLVAAGCRVALVTNQRGIARGVMTRADLEAVHRRLRTGLAEHGGRLDALLACPHAQTGCDCRKPRPGMIRRVLDSAPWADAARCLIIGDAESDLAAGAALGVPGILLGRDAPDLSAAVDAALKGRPAAPSEPGSSPRPDRSSGRS